MDIFLQLVDVTNFMYEYLIHFLYTNLVLKHVINCFALTILSNCYPGLTKQAHQYEFDSKTNLNCIVRFIYIVDKLPFHSCSKVSKHVLLTINQLINSIMA